MPSKLMNTLRRKKKKKKAAAGTNTLPSDSDGNTTDASDGEMSVSSLASLDSTASTEDAVDTATGKTPQYSTLPRPSDKSDAAAKRDAQHTANGDTKTGVKAPRSPPVERKQSRFAALGKIFKPWKWKRRKKPSEKIEAQAGELERKISLRTTREELIKRGILKGVDDNIPSSISEETNVVSNGRRPESSMYETIRSQLVFHPKYHEAEEAVQEEKSDSGVHANGTSSTADSVHLGDQPDIANHGNQVIHSDPSINDHRTYDSNNGSISSHDVTSNMHNTDMTQPNSRTAISPVVVNSGMYTMSGPKTVNMGPYSPGVGQMTPPAQMYEEVPAREPDLTKKPIRSAMKGAKYQEQQKQLQQQQQQQHHQRQLHFHQPQNQLRDNLQNDLQAQLKSKLAQKLEVRRTLSGSEHVHEGMGGTIRQKGPKVAPKPKAVSVAGGVRMVDPEGNKENEPDYDNLHSDSDEDGEIHWRDESESSLAAKVRRQDSLARFLSNRPAKRELIERNILPVKSEKEMLEDRQIIGIRLNRRLSLRPSAEELEDKNILHRQTPEEMRRDREERKRVLIRKLSFRPTVDELRERKIIKFSDYVEVTDANEYDRRADKPWTRLTPKDKAQIRKELNEYKSTEMAVHDDSRHLTRFHRP